MVRERFLGLIRCDQRSGNRRIHLAAMWKHDRRGRPVEPDIADVGIVANTLKAVGRSAADPAGGSAAHARRRADRFHGRQPAAPLRARDLVPARRHEIGRG